MTQSGPLYRRCQDVDLPAKMNATLLPASIYLGLERWVDLVTFLLTFLLTCAHAAQKFCESSKNEYLYHR